MKFLATLSQVIGIGLAVAVYVGCFLICIAGWVTHVIICIKSASWILLLFGCFFFPVGIIHGIGSWFGIF